MTEKMLANWVNDYNAMFEEYLEMFDEEIRFIKLHKWDKADELAKKKEGLYGMMQGMKKALEIFGYTLDEKAEKTTIIPL